jgi:PHD/YefM family antitoxin component YafN of YafNO toxin-antitoxin module
MNIPQIEPITTMAKDHKAVLAMLHSGPVILAQRSRPAAVLLSISDYEKMMTRLQHLELLAEARRNLARAEVEPATLISHDDLKRLLTEQNK